MIKRATLDATHFGNEWEQYTVKKYEKSKVDKSYYQPTSVLIKQMLGQNIINPLATSKGDYDFKAGEKDDGRPIGPTGYETLAELSEMQKRTEVKAQQELQELQKSLSDEQKSLSDEQKGTSKHSAETSATSDTTK